MRIIWFRGCHRIPRRSISRKMPRITKKLMRCTNLKVSLLLSLSPLSHTQARPNKASLSLSLSHTHTHTRPKKASPHDHEVSALLLRYNIGPRMKS